MAGMNVGPSTGFLARMKQNLPQALNQVGGMMPGPFGQTARLAGALTRRPVAPKQPSSSNMPSATPTGPQPPVNGPDTMPASTSMDSGIVRGPSRLPQIFGPGANTGVTGGFMPGQLGQMAQNGMPPGMNMQRNNLWANYGAMGGGNAGPMGRMFY